MTKTDMIASCAIIRTLSGVIFRNSETKSDEKAVTNVTERPIVIATETRFVIARVEQIPKTATRIWLLCQSWSLRYHMFEGLLLNEPLPFVI